MIRAVECHRKKISWALVLTVAMVVLLGILCHKAQSQGCYGGYGYYQQPVQQYYYAQPMMSYGSGGGAQMQSYGSGGGASYYSQPSYQYYSQPSYQYYSRPSYGFGASISLGAGGGGRQWVCGPNGCSFQ